MWEREHRSSSVTARAPRVQVGARPSHGDLVDPPRRFRELVAAQGPGPLAQALTGQPARSFGQIPISAATRGAPAQRGCRACASTRNPNGQESRPTTQDPSPGATPVSAPRPAPEAEPTPEPAPALARPAAHAELASGPTFTPRGAITPTTSGGLKSAGPWDMDAVFASDPSRGVFPSCGEVHQDIKWNRAAADSFDALFGSRVPHSGFPSTHPPNVWIEDRDAANTRYGRRSGPMSAPVTGGDEYTDIGGGRNMARGPVYHGNDNPSNWPAALTGRWTFMLLAFDMCNRGVQVGNADFITIDW